MVETVRELIDTIINECVKDNGMLTNNDVYGMVQARFKGGEDDLPEDVVIPHPTFVSIAKAIFAAKNGGFRRDAIILLHLYVEAYVIKMVRAADMIAATNKRSRCQGVDLQLAFAIHNL